MRRRVPMTVDEMEIAPGITVADWKSLELANKKECEADWQRAIDILEHRLRKRYFEPVALLVKADAKGAPSDMKYGFAIMAINCLLVETLQSFRMGKVSTKDQSRELSIKFLTTNKPFAKEFNHDTAERYYTDIRCGVLHLGETMNMSLISADGPLVQTVTDGIVVNRTSFFENLEKWFADYVADLRSETATQRRTDLRNKLKRKMNAICRLKT